MAVHVTNNQVAFIYSPQYQAYHFYDDHPFNQRRVVVTYDLLQKTGALQHNQILEPRIATDEELALFHSKRYIEHVKKAPITLLSEEDIHNYGIGTEDTPSFPRMHEASALLVGGTLTAVDAIMEKGFQYALNLGGGLHHGFATKASGFCIYNDAAVAIRVLQKKYGLRVMYIDTDAHHGDGVQWGFYEDPTVCTLSIHETGKYLFPGTGSVSERGHHKGYKYSFNVPLDAYTQDESFLNAYRETALKIADFFKPDILITQNGADAHLLDPLTHLSCSIDIFKEIPKVAREIANTYCNGRWIALGGGGYNHWNVVPRAWSLVWLEMTGQLIPSSIPEKWIERWKHVTDCILPTTWSDPPECFPTYPRKLDINERNSLTVESCLSILHRT